MSFIKASELKNESVSYTYELEEEIEDFIYKIAKERKNILEGFCIAFENYAKSFIDLNSIYYIKDPNFKVYLSDLLHDFFYSIENHLSKKKLTAINLLKELNNNFYLLYSCNLDENKSKKQVLIEQIKKLNFIVCYLIAYLNETVIIDIK